VSDVHGALTAQAELLDALLGPDPPPPRRAWPYVVLAVVLVAAAAAVGVWAFVRDPAPSGPPHPSSWDPRVQKYVDFVEQKRELRFTHPVYVDFLSDADFTKQVTSDPSELSDDDKAELEHYAGMLRALGLVQGDVDLFDTSNELQGAGIIGFYSYQDERLRIRGTTITPAVESTIVHELTHALQDQNFDLGKRFEELDKADDANSSAASSGFHALVEGDARRIETMWRDGLSDADRAALDKEKTADAKGFEAAAHDIPDAMVTMLEAPYDLGEALLAVAVQQGGDRAVDDLFRSPPKTEEQQLDPWTLVADHQGFLTVPKPELPDGVKTFDDGAFGSVGWLLVLSERLPVEQALTAVDGWGGDSYAAYEQDGVSCVSMSWRGDTVADRGQMQAALVAWVAKGPKGAATVTRDDLTLHVTSCDPGKHVAGALTGKSMDAVLLALRRTYLSLQLVKGGADLPFARCGADRLVRAFTLAQLNDPHPDRDRVLRAMQPCRRG
jgi:hypothetical protein